MRWKVKCAKETKMKIRKKKSEERLNEDIKRRKKKQKDTCTGYMHMEKIK